MLRQRCTIFFLGSSLSEVKEKNFLRHVLLNPKTDLGKTKPNFFMKQIRNERIMKGKWPIFNDFGLRSPVFQKPFLQTKSATSIVARVIAHESIALSVHSESVFGRGIDPLK